MSPPDWLLITSPSSWPSSLTLARRALSCFTQASTKGSLTGFYSLGPKAGSVLRKPLIGGRALVYFGKSAAFLSYKFGLHSINFFAKYSHDSD
jgi:hypothetical protein